MISSAQVNQILNILPSPSSLPINADATAAAHALALRTQTPAQAPAQSATPAVPHMGFAPPMSPPASTKTPAHEKAMQPISGPTPSQQQQQQQQPPPQYTPTALVISRAEALWAFPGSEAGDLSFRADDLIEVVEKVKDDWWRGRIAGTTEIGLFPSSYVKETQVLARGPPMLPVRKDGGVAAGGGSGGYGPGGNMMTDVAHGGTSSGGDGGEKQSALGKNGEKFGKKLGNGESRPHEPAQLCISGD